MSIKNRFYTTRYLVFRRRGTVVVEGSRNTSEKLGIKQM